MKNQFGADDEAGVAWIGGQTVLEYYEQKYVDVWANIGYLSLFYVVFFALTLLALTYKNYAKR